MADQSPDKPPVDASHLDPFAGASDEPQAERPPINRDWMPRTLFNLKRLAGYVPKDVHEAAVLKLLSFLNEFEATTIGYESADEVESLRVELAADLLRKELRSTTIDSKRVGV